MPITKKNVPFIETPLGTLELYMDGKPTLFHTAIWYAPGELVIGTQKMDVPVIRMICPYQADAKEHSLLIRLNSDFVGGIDSGENLEALTFDTDDFSMTVGCFAAFREDTLDFDGSYDQNEIQIEIDSETSSQAFCFGVSWMVPNGDDDARAWLAADPFDEWRKNNLCCP